MVSNPPYIPMSACESCRPRSRDHDPPTRLWGGGDDGLDAIRVVERAARRLLRPGGCVAVEHADLQGDASTGVFAEEDGWRDVRDHRDLAGRDRFVTARRRPTARRPASRERADGKTGDRERRYDCSDPIERTRGHRRGRAAVRRGELVVLPTDTVYGIGADAFDAAAVAALLEAKGRGRDMPPPVLVGPWRAGDGAGRRPVPATASELVDEFWPGALTLVCRAATLQWDLGETNGHRRGPHAAARLAIELLKETGPLAVSSANLTGRPPPARSTRPRSSATSVGVYLDGGPAGGGSRRRSST